MKKRILAILLCICMLLSCVACGNRVEEQNDNPISQQKTDTEIPQKDVEVGDISMEITDFSVR